MRRYLEIQQAAREREDGRPRAVTVGFFDGVHRGHARLLEELKAWAREEGAETAVVTFDRHPQAVLDGHPPRPVVSLEHRLLLLERRGIGATLVLEFNEELASWSAWRFADRVLKEALGARYLLFGFDGAFGHGREGTYESLLPRQRELGIEVRRSRVELVGGERVSSTLIRREIARGDLERVQELLGREFSVLGRVAPGDRRGRTLGFPTANLEVSGAALPPRGVYFAEALRLGRAVGDTPARGFESLPGAAVPAVVNIGCRPTVSGSEPRGAAGGFEPGRDRVEAHLLDFEGDLYGEYLEVFFLHRHRAEARFADLRELAARIAADVAARRAWEGARPPAMGSGR